MYCNVIKCVPFVNSNMANADSGTTTERKHLHIWDIDADRNRGQETAPTYNLVTVATFNLETEGNN